MIAFINPKTRWFPQTFYYASYAGEGFPLFLRATQNKHFEKLSIITGIDEVAKLKEVVIEGYKRNGAEQWPQFHFRNFLTMMNLDNLGTLK